VSRSALPISPGEQPQYGLRSPMTSVHPCAGLLSHDGCAVARQPASWSLREESSWLDRLPVVNDRRRGSSR
jgi:hypothetical protein